MNKVPLFATPMRLVSTLALLALAGLGVAPRALAQANSHPPERMTYQGYLVDANGNPLGTNTTKNYDVIFRIWNSESGTAAGNRLWTEQQTVTVDKGYFSVLLGEGSSIGEARPELSTIFTNSTASDRWVGLTVKGIGPGNTDVNILPRLRLLTSPYAFLAKAVSGTGVVNANNLDPAIGLWTAAGGNVYRSSGNVGIADSTPDFPLSFPNTVGDKISLWGNAGNHLGFGVTGGALQIHGANVNDDITFGYGSSAAMTETMRIKGNGNVGIGTPNPAYPLTVQNAGGYGLVHKGGGITLGTYVDGNGGWLGTQTLDPLRFFVGDGWSSLLIATNGNVGIGNDDPRATLDIGGTMRVHNGIAAPPANGVAGSASTRLVLWPGSASSTPYGFGIDSSTLWAGVPAGAFHRWFVGTSGKMSLYSGGELNIVDTSTGVSGRLRVGTGGWSDVAASVRANSGDNYMLDLQDATGNIRMIFRNDGTPFRTGGTTWAVWSDARLKQKVSSLSGALDQLLGLRSVEFEYTDGERFGKGLQRGFLAQQVQTVFPDWVHEAPDGMLAVECKGFESLTVQALRELRAEKDAAVKSLAAENATLKATVEDQAKRLAALEALIQAKLGGLTPPAPAATPEAK